MEFIYWLDGPDEPVANGFGGKAASLWQLARAGFPVPAGFVVCAAGYRAWVRENGLEPYVDALLATPDLRLPKVARESSAALREAAQRAAAPSALRNAVLDAYAKLQERCGGDLVVAVRSSALSEDGAAASSAGLYDTCLNVRDAEALTAALHHCYCSLWAHRAVQYRAFKGIDGRAEAMGLVVMEMVPAQVSGVAFTVNPVTGSAAEIVINASWGLGEAIVSGRVTPDSFTVRKSDLTVLSRGVYEKELMILPDPSGASGTVAVAVPPERVATPALGDALLADLARLCLRVEAHYGCPQDVEWALREGCLYLLQSRPVTALR